MARPTKYREEYCIQAEKLCRKGFIDTEIADFFEVNVDTIYEWKKVHTEFSDALKSGKRHSDSKVVDALYNRALGYEYEEHKTEESDQGVKKTVTKKKMAADTTAQIFWLKNRDSKNWKDKQDINHSGSISSADDWAE